MKGFERLAERNIRKAQREGAFDRLEGHGKPLPPDALEGLDEAARAEALVLRSVGGAPEEVHLLREVHELRDRVAATPDGPEREALRARLRERALVLEMLFERTGRSLSALAASKLGAG